MRHFGGILLASGLIFGGGGVMFQYAEASNEGRITKEQAFIAAHEKRMAPLEKRANLAWWDANISGRDEDFKKKEDAQNAYDQALSDAKAFAKLKAIRESLPKSAEALVRRQIEVLYL